MENYTHTQEYTFSAPHVTVSQTDHILDTKQVSKVQENWNNSVSPNWPPWINAGYQQQKQVKGYKLMETEQSLLTEKMNQKRN